MFSIMNVDKNSLRNYFDFSTLAALLQIKSYHCEEKPWGINGNILSYIDSVKDT